ncbi:MAG: glycosyltransferase [Actinomycetota bacterium]|nr:glycosyltransferase [Actinomycetota bacterium]
MNDPIPDVTRIGVVTPSLNGETYLKQTLESIWSQASETIRVDHVLVDGGSTDSTLEIASGYPTRTVVSPDDQGMYDAINRGMSLVEGDIVGYINADDEIAPGAFRLIADAFRRHPNLGWLCGRVEYNDATDDIIGGYTPVHLSLASYIGIGWSCIPQQTVWARRSFFDRVGPFDIAFKNCGDYDWYARALHLQHPLMMKETLGLFRLHGAQLSFDPEKMDRESRMVQDRNGGRSRLGWLRGRLLSLKLNARNLAWLYAKKTGRIKFTA